MKNKMKSSDKLGYILLIMGFFAVCYKYGGYLLFETIYLFNGEKKELIVSAKENVGDKYLYHFKDSSGQVLYYASQLTKKQLDFQDTVLVRTVPIFSKVLFGSFMIAPYFIGIILFIFMLFIAFISVCMIFNISNRFTNRIKQTRIE